MSPEDRQRLDTLEQKVNRLLEVLDVPFIESAKRRIVKPYVDSLNLDDAMTLISAGTTAGILQSVNEAGSETYSVAEEFDGSLIITTPAGQSYKLGYYNV